MGLKNFGKKVGRAGLGLARGLGSATIGLGKAAIGASELIGTGPVHFFEKSPSVFLGAIGVGALTGAVIADANHEDPKKGAAVLGGGAAVGASLGLAPAIALGGAAAADIAVTGIVGTATIASKAVKLPKEPLSLKNLDEIKIKKGAIPLIAGASLITGALGAYRTLEKSRMGTSDGRYRTPTPDLPTVDGQGRYSPNTYGGIDYSNTGATGDLVFAMHKNR